MALSADLEAGFGEDGFSLSATLDVSAGDLAAVAFDATGVDLGALSAVVDTVGNVDTGSIDTASTDLLAGLTTLIADLPVVDDAVAPLRSVLSLADVVTGTGVTDAIAAVDTAVTIDGSTGVPALEARLQAVDAIRSDPSVQSLLDLTSGLVGDAFDLDGTVGDVGAWLRGLRELLGLIAGLMSVETGTRDLLRLTELGSQMLVPGEIETALAAVTRYDGASLDDLLSGIDPNDAQLVDLVAGPIVEYSLALRRLEAVVARGMAFGEATLAQAGIERLAARVDTAAAALREDGLAAIRTVAEQLRSWLDPLLAIELPDPQGSVDDFADAVIAAVADLAGAIDQLDPALLAAPVTTAFADALSVFDTIAAAAEEVRTLLGDALGTVRAAVEAIDLGPIIDTIRAALDPLATAIDTVEGLITDAQAGIEGASAQAIGALETVKTSLGAAAGAVQSAFDRLNGLVDALGLDSLQEQLEAIVQPAADFVASAQLAPYFDTANDVIDTTATVLDAVPLSILPDDALQELADAVEPIKQIDFQRDVADVLKDKLAEILEALDTDVLDAIEAAYADVVEFLESVDPNDALLALETDVFDPMIAAVRSVDIESILAPIDEALAPIREAIVGFDPVTEVLQPIEDLIDQVVAAVESFDPAAVLEPIEAQVDEVRDGFTQALLIDQWSDWLDRAEELVVDGLARLDIEALVEALDGAHDGLIAEVRSGGGGPSAIGTLVAGLFESAGLVVSADCFGTVTSWIGGADGATQVQQRLTDAADALDRQLAAVEAVEFQDLINRLQPTHRSIMTALEAHPADSLLRVRLDAQVAIASPQELFAPLIDGHTTYVASLRDAAVAVRRLAASGRSEITAVSQGLREALRPLQAAVDRGRALLARFGLDPAALSLRELIVELLATFRPSRLLAPLTAAVVALRDKLERLAVDGVIAPVRDAVTSIEATIAAVDIGFIRTELSATHAEIVALIESLSPSVILGDVLTEFTELQAAIDGFDPLAPVRAAVDALTAVIDEVDTQFRPTVLFAPVTDLYQRIVDALGVLDLRSVLQPLLDGLAVIELQLGEGLDATAESLGRLQDSLPDSSDLGGSGASASVGVGVG